MKNYPKTTVMKIREDIFKNTLNGKISVRDRERLKKLYIFEGKYFKDNYTMSVNLQSFADYMLGCGYLYGFLCGIDIKTELEGEKGNYKINTRLIGILLTVVLRETLIHGSKIGIKIDRNKLLIYTDFKIKNKVHLTPILKELNALSLFNNNNSEILIPITYGTQNLVIKNEFEYYKNPFSVFNVFIK